MSVELHLLCADFYVLYCIVFDCLSGRLGHISSETAESDLAELCTLTMRCIRALNLCHGDTVLHCICVCAMLPFGLTTNDATAFSHTIISYTSCRQTVTTTTQNKCVSKTHIDKRGGVVETICSTGPLLRATSPSLIVCLYLAYSKLLKLTAAASNARVV